MKRRGLDKTRFAAYLRVDRSTVSRWLSGSVVPGNEHLGLLAERLDRPYAEILNLARADTRERRSGRKAQETLAEEVALLAAEVARRDAQIAEMNARLEAMNEQIAGLKRTRRRRP